MPKPTDCRPVAVELYFLPIKTRVPLKFGPEVTTEVTCARVKMTVEDSRGRRADRLGRDAAVGSVGLAQPASVTKSGIRHCARLCITIAETWVAALEEPAIPWKSGTAFSNTFFPT